MPETLSDPLALSSEFSQALDPQPWLIAQAQQPYRAALVIGNADYEEDPLANPINDAMAIYEKLRGLGFDVPPPLINGTKEQMVTALREFRGRLRPGGVGVFYYAGHGVQVGGENYLVPLGTSLNYEEEVEFDAIALSRVLRTMEGADTEINILFMDACRDNPFYRKWRSTRGSGVRGLTKVDPARGTLIAHATEPGNVAEDGSGRNSPFTTSLLQHIETPGLSIESLFKRVATDVIQATNDRQSPWLEGFVIGEFSFNPEVPDQTSPTPIALQPTPEIVPTPEPIRELDQIPLDSDRGVDYTQLRDLLAEGKWKEADLETLQVMLQAADRVSEGWLDTESIESFSCTDLRTIDQLWSTASGGRFGFGVQAEIFTSDAVGGSPGQGYDVEIWRKLADQVGWHVNQNYLSYDELTFSLDAVRGHLPALAVFWWGGLGEWAGTSSLVEMSVSCSRS